MAAGILFLVVRMVMMMILMSWRVVVGCTSNCLHYSAKSGNRIYKFRLGAPINNYPHGILSEDGFYSVARNGTKLWFQACDQMIFNHDPPKCFRCEGCGGASQCGTQCGGLISVNIDGYHVCSAVGQAASTEISLIDKKKPRLGVLLKMVLPHLISQGAVSILKCILEGRNRSTKFENLIANLLKEYFLLLGCKHFMLGSQVKDQEVEEANWMLKEFRLETGGKA